MTTAADAPKTSWRPRSTPWRRAGCTTTSAGASPATRSTASGSCRTSRRCCTTRPCSCKTYLHGLIVIGAPQWRQVLDETITYVLTTLRHPDGGFYSAEDADSPDADGHGVEGLFHTWTPDEARAAHRGPAADDARRGARLVRHHRRRELRGRRSIPNRLHARGALARPPEIEAGTPDAVRRPRAPPTSRPRRQGAHRVERAVPGRPGRGGRRARTGRTGSMRRWPTPSS